MIYDTKNKIEAHRAQEYLTRLIDRGVQVEVKEKRKKRTYKQNRYLHLILTYFGIETGYTLEESKILFKRLNHEIFRYDKNGYAFMKSTKDVSKEEMIKSIDKFKNYSAKEVGVVLPDSDDYEFLNYIEKLESQNYQYL